MTTLSSLRGPRGASRAVAHPGQARNHEVRLIHPVSFRLRGVVAGCVRLGKDKPERTVMLAIAKTRYVTYCITQEERNDFHRWRHSAQTEDRGSAYY